MSLDKLLDRSRRSKSNALSFANSATQIGTAEIDDRHLDLMVANCLQSFVINNISQHIQIGLWRPSTSHNQRNGELANGLRFSPSGKLTERIGAHQQKQLGVVQLLFDLGQRIDGVTYSAAIDLKGTDAKIIGTTHCQLQHFDPQFGGRHFTALLMGWHRGGNKPNLIQLRLLAACFRQQQMAVVHRIKEPPKTPKRIVSYRVEWAATRWSVITREVAESKREGGCVAGVLLRNQRIPSVTFDVVLFTFLSLG